MDTSFSIAVHILILASEADAPLSSEEMAGSVGTNASRIRKIAGLLRRRGLIESRQGSKGFSLAHDPSAITLLDIHHAVQETDEPELFDIHRNPNDACIVGRFIRPTLRSAFASIEAETARALGDTTLADVIEDMRDRAHRAGVL